jgi:hypothetical protein
MFYIGEGHVYGTFWIFDLDPWPPSFEWDLKSKRSHMQALPLYLILSSIHAQPL